MSSITAIHLLLRQLFMMIGQGNVNVTAFFAQLTIKTGSHTDGDYLGERQAGRLYKVWKMDSTPVETLIAQNSEIVEYIRVPRGRCFDCAVKVASILRACDVRHRIVGMLIWDSFTREADTHFVVAVYGLEDAFKRDNPGVQPLLEYFQR